MLGYLLIKLFSLLASGELFLCSFDMCVCYVCLLALTLPYCLKLQEVSRITFCRSQFDKFLSRALNKLDWNTGLLRFSVSCPCYEPVFSDLLAFYSACT